MFKKAERKRSKLRLALCGPSGSGKTYSALQMAFGMGGNGKCEDCLLTEPCSNCGEMVKTDDMMQSFYAEGWLCPECAEAIEKEAKHGLPCAS